jgi:hypothetical protein
MDKHQKLKEIEVGLTLYFPWDNAEKNQPFLPNRVLKYLILELYLMQS